MRSHTELAEKGPDHFKQPEELTPDVINQRRPPAKYAESHAKGRAEVEAQAASSEIDAPEQTTG